MGDYIREHYRCSRGILGVDTISHIDIHTFIHTFYTGPKRNLVSGMMVPPV